MREGNNVEQLLHKDGGPKIENVPRILQMLTFNPRGSCSSIHRLQYHFLPLMQREREGGSEHTERQITFSTTH